MGDCGGRPWAALAGQSAGAAEGHAAFKLDAQDTGSRSRGRQLFDGGVRARFYHAVCEAHLRRIVRVDLKSELFTYDIEIGPVYHRLPDRIRAHACICFIALVLARVMRARMRQTPVPDVQYAPTVRSWAPSRIQTHRMRFDA